MEGNHASFYEVHMLDKNANYKFSAIFVYSKGNVPNCTFVLPRSPSTTVDNPLSHPSTTVDNPPPTHTHTSTTVDNPHPTPQQLVITPTTPQQLLIRDCFVSSKMNNREFVVCQFCGFTCNFYFYIWYYWYIDLFKLFQFLIIMQTPLSPQQYMYMYCHLRHWWHVHVHVFINYMLQIWFLELSQTKTLEIDNMFYSETNIFVPKKITVTLLL